MAYDPNSHVLSLSVLIGIWQIPMGSGTVHISVQASIIMGLQGAVSQTALQPGQPSHDVRPTVESWYFANNKLH